MADQLNIIQISKESLLHEQDDDKVLCLCALKHLTGMQF